MTWWDRLNDFLDQSPRPREKAAIVLLMVLLWIALIVIGVKSVKAADGCRPYPVGPDSPSGIVGCVIYGQGIASMWTGPGVARNDCEYPWDSCTPIIVTSLDTGLQIIVTPTMFCDCYTGTPDERIVDLDPAAVAALGLVPADGLWRVDVQAWRILMPDTATR